VAAEDQHSALAATTTAEENRKTAGQRQINLIWEYTQGIVALLVTATALFVAARLALRVPSEPTALQVLSSGFFLVIGFYYGRTNHQRTGGVGGDTAGTR
jgi:cobalamin synthase